MKADDMDKDSPSGDQKRHIRYHRKSRTGCFSCKKRRVKCDEVHPTCGNCSRREVDCIWDQPNIRQQTEGRELARFSPLLAQRYGEPTPPSPVDMDSLMLIHHYTIATYPSVYSKSICATACKVTIPQLSFTSPFLLHSMLSITALHLEILNTDGPEAANYALMALTHKNTALSLLPTLTGVSDANLLGIGLLTMFTLCSSLRTSECSIFPMLKTIHNIWHGMQGYSFTDHSLKTLDWVHLLNNLPDNPDNPFPVHLFSIYLPTSDFPDAEELEDPDIVDAYKSAVDALCTARPFSYSGYELVAAIKWPELFSTKFLELLLEKRPRALVILYHYCAMLHGVSHCWWSGDSLRRMEYVRSLLDEKWRFCLDSNRSYLDEITPFSSAFLTRSVY